MERPVGFSHVALRCRDLARCERFYRSVLGLDVLRRWPAEGGGDRSVWLELDGGRAFLALERADLREPADAREEASGGWNVVALSIERTTRPDWEARLAAHGVEVARKSAWSLFFRDPEGNRLALTHWPEEW
jgi:catechol 2,3-dioxygenase-like lactoylglutathione lyase family enzyme